MAKVYKSLKDYDKSIECHEKALEIIKKNREDEYDE